MHSSKTNATARPAKQLTLTLTLAQDMQQVHGLLPNSLTAPPSLQPSRTATPLNQLNPLNQPKPLTPLCIVNPPGQLEGALSGRSSAYADPPAIAPDLQSCMEHWQSRSTQPLYDLDLANPVQASGSGCDPRSLEGDCDRLFVEPLDWIVKHVSESQHESYLI